MADLIVAAILEFILFATAGAAFFLLDRRQPGEAKMIYVQNEGPSMAVIYAAFGVCFAALQWMLQSLTCLDGFRIAVAVANATALGYLFLFSGWFRVRVIFPVHRRVRETSR
jgi:hypothetical protein